MNAFFNRFEQQTDPVADAYANEEESVQADSEWGGHPHAVVPGRSNQVVTLFRTDAGTLVLCCIDAYPNCIEFSLRLLTAKNDRRGHMGPLDLLSFGARERSPLSVRLGVEFEDGRCWSSLGQPPTYPISSERNDIVVMSQGVVAEGGSGSFGSRSGRYRRMVRSRFMPTGPRRVSLSPPPSLMRPNCDHSRGRRSRSNLPPHRRRQHVAVITVVVGTVVVGLLNGESARSRPPRRVGSCQTLSRSQCTPRARAQPQPQPSNPLHRLNVTTAS